MQKVPFFHDLPLGTLANETVVASTLLPTSDNEYRILSSTAAWSMRGLTSGEVPIQFGYAHGDYSVTEIDQCLEAEGAMTRANKIVKEQADRLVRSVGVISGDGISPVYNNGEMKYSRLNWGIPDGLTTQFWARNQTGGTMTTGSGLVIVGHAIIRWT